MRCGRSVHRHSLKFLLPSCSSCCRSRKKNLINYAFCIVERVRERIIELNHVLELRDIRRKTSFLCLRQCIFFTLYNRIYMRDVFHARKLHFESLFFVVVAILPMRPWCLDRHTLKIILHAFTSLTLDISERIWGMD